MNDKKLYELCKKYGRASLTARRKFIGLLPEVYKRRLYEKKGFYSIFEFATRLAGVSHEQVRVALRLEERFDDKPVLRKALVEGEVSINKLSRIASIATNENEKELFEKTKLLSSRAIETFVRDVRNQSKLEDSAAPLFGGKESICGVGEGQLMVDSSCVQDVQKSAKNKNQNGLSKPLIERKSLHVQRLELDEDIENQLFEMQEKGIDINSFLRVALKKRKAKIEEKKQEIAEEQIKLKNERAKQGKTPTKYCQIKVKKIIQEEHGTKCSYPGCFKPSKTLHHTQRFGLTGVHDPRFMAPLCEEHHEIAHKIDVRFVEKAMGSGP